MYAFLKEIKLCIFTKRKVKNEIITIKGTFSFMFILCVTRFSSSLILNSSYRWKVYPCLICNLKNCLRANHRLYGTRPPWWSQMLSIISLGFRMVATSGRLGNRGYAVCAVRTVSLQYTCARNELHAPNSTIECLRWVNSSTDQPSNITCTAHMRLASLSWTYFCCQERRRSPRSAQNWYGGGARLNEDISQFLNPDVACRTGWLQFVNADK